MPKDVPKLIRLENDGESHVIATFRHSDGRLTETRVLKKYL